MKAKKTTAFPFFGAGKGNYYEWCEVDARFVNKPSNEQIKEIIKLAPKPIKPKKSDFWGKMMMAGSDQFVNLYINETYNKDFDPASYDEEEENLPFEFYVSDDALKAFETHIESWLIEVHTFCPIEFAYRAEDWEAGGSKLSGWHKKSVLLIPEMIMAWNNDKETFRQKKREKEHFKYCLAGIFEFGKVKPDEVPKPLIDAFFPEKTLKKLFDTKKVNEAINFICQNNLDEEIEDVIVEALEKFIKNKKYKEINLLTEIFLSHNSKYDFLLISNAGNLAYAIVKTKNQILTDKFIKVVSNKNEEIPNDIVNKIGQMAFSLHSEKTFDEAIKLYEIALDIKTDTFRESEFWIYNNALWIAQNDNTGLPINFELNEKFLSVCLPLGPKNPAIFFNATCLNVEMEEYDKAVNYVQFAIKSKYEGLKEMINQINNLSLFTEFKKYPALVAALKKINTTA